MIYRLNKRCMKKIVTMLKSASVVLVAATIISACGKSVATPGEGSEAISATSGSARLQGKEYELVNMSGATAGIFRIAGGDKGEAVVEVQLNDNARVPGTMLTAKITNPQRNGTRPLYVKLNDVDGTSGYGITRPVVDGSGVVMADQLALKIGFEVEIWNGSTMVAHGAIR
jgi:hypothetical protein